MSKSRAAEMVRAASSIDLIEDDDLPPEIKAPTRAPRAFKVGTRKPAPPTATGIGEPPWWASTDPQVWEAQRPQVIARGRTIKAPGELQIIGMGSAV